MLSKILDIIGENIEYINLRNLQIVFEALKKLGIKFDETPDENNNVMCVDCENCKNCILCCDCINCDDCQICVDCLNCKKCWYCSQLDGDEEVHVTWYDVMRNEPLTDEDKEELNEYIDFIKESLDEDE